MLLTFDISPLPDSGEPRKRQDATNAFSGICVNIIENARRHGGESDQDHLRRNAVDAAPPVFQVQHQLVTTSAAATVLFSPTLCFAFATFCTFSSH